MYKVALSDDEIVAVKKLWSVTSEERRKDHGFGIEVCESSFFPMHLSNLLSPPSSTLVGLVLRVKFYFAPFL